MVARGQPEHVLALEPAHLVAGRDARAELHELVVEERHAHLERAGHRGAVEVGEHVVDQAEPRVQVERGLERRGAGGAGQAAAQHGLGGAGVLGERAGEQVAAAGRRAPGRSTRAGARPGRAACSDVHEPPGAARPVAQRGRRARRAADPARAPRSRRARPRGACGSRRAARRRPGPTARPSRARRASSQSGRKPSEERSASGSSRCQTRRASSAGSLLHRHLELVVVGAVPRGHAARVAELGVLAGEARPRRS